MSNIFIKAVLFYSIFLINKESICQIPNCNVQAKINYANDSIFTTQFDVVLRSQSINATNYKWSLNGYLNLSIEDTFHVQFNEVGLYRIQLIAANNQCADTTYVNFLITGIDTFDRNYFESYYGFEEGWEEGKKILPTQDSGYLLCGETDLRYRNVPPNQANNYSQDGMLIKISKNGCVQWSKTMDATYGGEILNAFDGLNDDKFILGHNDFIPYVKKINSITGHQYWNRNIQFNQYYLSYTSGVATADGGCVLSGLNLDSSVFLVKLNNNGAIQWSRRFDKFIAPFEYNYLANAQVTSFKNNIYHTLVISTQIPNTVNFTHKCILNKINLINGSIIWSKQLTKGDSLYLGVRDFETINNNLHILLDGIVGQDFSVALLNQSDTIIKALGIANNSFVHTNGVLKLKYNNFTNRINVLQSGSIPLQLQPYYSLQTVPYVFDTAYNLHWMGTFGGAGYGFHVDFALGKDNNLALVGREFGSGYNAYNGRGKIQFKKLNPEIIDSVFGQGCGYFLGNINKTNVNIYTIPYVWDSTYLVIQTAKDTIGNLINAYTKMRYKCPVNFIDSCAYINVNGPSEICNINQTYKYRIQKATGCGVLTRWKLHPSIQIISQTDKEIIVKFTQLGSYIIGAELPFSCNPVFDSIKVNVVIKYPKPNLGNDTTLCTGNTLQLSTQPIYQSYQWNTGAATNTITISQSGSYWVKVIDSCGNTLSDTINVFSINSIPMNIADTLIKCNYDTTSITLSNNFSNISWSPLNSTFYTNNTISFFPNTTTKYYLSANSSNGCLVKDSVFVKVNKSPLIWLGNDTSFCQNDSIILGLNNPSFISAVWSNGSNNFNISVNSLGTYWVKAKDFNNCVSTDTIKILALHPLPIVDLGNDSTICLNNNKILTINGSGFVNQLWNTGATTPTININNIGLYKVVVKSSNGCKNGDSLKVNTWLQNPNQFLFNDTTKCIGQTIKLISNLTFQNYLWSNGFNSPSINITTPGNYWLRVTDAFGCIGNDTINVTTKECLKGVYIPTIFTPNNDGINDVFTPKCYGNFEFFEFSIYNRFGQKVFFSNIPNSIWDGSFKNKNVDFGAYIFVVRFKLQNEKQNIIKGTVLVSR
jgi:gliding motility-associated-like protein